MEDLFDLVAANVRLSANLAAVLSGHEMLKGDRADAAAGELEAMAAILDRNQDPDASPEGLAARLQAIAHLVRGRR